MTISREGIAFSTFAPLGPRRRLPLRPRFLRELVVIPDADGVLIDGGKQPQMLAGDGSLLLLPRLLPLMDGSRTISEIHEQLPGIPAAALHDALFQLSNWGLIEDRRTGNAAEGALNPDTLAFFCRHISTGVYQNGVEACQELTCREIVLVDSLQDSAAIELLKSILTKTGVSRVKTLSPAAVLEHEKPYPVDSLIVSLSFHNEDYDWHAKLDDHCHNHHGSWLRAVLSIEKGFADLGPLFNEVNACYRCFHTLHCASQNPAAGSDVRQERAADTQMLTSLLAMEIICLLNHFGPSVTWRGLQRYDLPEWNPKNLRCIRIPGCSRCRPDASQLRDCPSHRTQTLVDTAVVFEDYIALPSRPHFPAGQEDGSSEINELPRQTTRLSNCSQVSLGSVSLHLEEAAVNMPAKTAEPAGPLTIDHLATILKLTAGLRDPETGSSTIQRWAATAGNLGSVELFVIAARVRGLEPGIYFYQAADHSLALLQRRDTVPVLNDLIRRIAPQQAKGFPDALVLFTAAFHRVVKKYFQFGYRLIQFDAGVGLSQMHLAARALNIEAQTVARWPDDLIEHLLNLTPVQQQVTAVAVLRGQGNKPHDSEACYDQHVRAERPVSAKCVSEFAEAPIEWVFDMLMSESRLRETGLHSGPFDASFEQLRPQLGSLALPLPAPCHVNSSALGVLTQRNSVRHFRNESVLQAHVSSMLHHAYHGDLNDWPAEHAQLQPLTFLVLASRLEGCRRGIYEYVHNENGLAPLWPATHTEEIAGLFVQPEFEYAPVVIWIAGNLAAACARHGSFGHRQLLVRAGAAANRLWIAALAMGLKGCIVAGLVPGVARLKLNLDGYRRASLIAFAGGHGTSLLYA